MINLFKDLPSYYQDNRSQQQQIKEHQKILDLTQINLKQFNISNLEEQKSIKDKRNFKYKKLKASFSDGAYCYYTDNLQDCLTFPNKITIFTIPGLPGGVYEWQYLHQKIGYNYCRWINFVIPGQDKEEEIRGQYTGTFFEVRNLILRLLDQLKIHKIILIFHSFGTYYATDFAMTHPERVNGMVFLGPTALTAHCFHQNIEIGLQDFLKRNQIEFSKRFQYLNDPVFRQKLKKEYEESTDELEMAIKQILTYKFYEFMCFYKTFLSYDEGFNQQYERERKWKSPMLKFFAGGCDDTIIGEYLLNEMFYHFTFGENAWVKNNNLTQQQKQIIIKAFQQQGVQFNQDDLQQNFVFLFEDGVHQIHIKSINKLEKPLKCYLSIIELLYQQELSQDKIKPKL